MGQVRLRVLAEYADGAPQDEARAMRIAPGAPVWIREVLMSVDGVDSVPARSLTPLAASHGAWQGMRRLRTRPLADMLYHDRTVIRSPSPAAGWPRPCPFTPPPSARCRRDARTRCRPHLARRSVFWRQGRPLLVAECFLPAFWQLVAGKPVPPLMPHQRTPR